MLDSKNVMRSFIDGQLSKAAFTQSVFGIDNHIY